MVTSPNHWVDIGQERAKNHPLYGVKGWLLVSAVLLVLYLLVSPILQIIVQELAGYESPRFHVSFTYGLLWFIALGIFRKRRWVRFRERSKHPSS